MFKFLIVDTYYWNFLDSFYKKNITNNKTYNEHHKMLMDELFGTSDFYSKNLNKLKCDANEVIFNDLEIQYKWLREFGNRRLYSFFPKNIKTINKIITKFDFIPLNLNKYYKILKSQIKHYQPDVLYIQDMTKINDKFLSEIKNYVKIIVGQLGSSIPKNRDFKVYDLIFTSFPHYVNKIRKMGINAEYLKIGFEPDILPLLNNGLNNRKYGLTFIGGLTKSHTKRIHLLEKLASEVEIDIWGYGIEGLPNDSIIKGRYHGEAWGIDMYRILSQSKITLNFHGEIAENYANNMRLFEATGCGSLLITDQKDNMNILYKVGKEVITYKDSDELINLVKYYLANPNEANTIANLGKERTIKEHTYFNRMKEIIEILPKYMN